MRSIHPIFLTSPIAFLLLLFILYCHSFRPISFLCTVILSDLFPFFVLAFFLLLAIYALNCYLFRHLLLYIRYFPYNYTVMYMCKK